jgi:C4-dicarboxylate transporter DctM subunit
MITVLFIIFFACMFFGVPIGFSMGMGTLGAFILTNPRYLPIFTQRLWGGLDSFPLMAVPLFLLAGVLMEEGGVSKRLVAFANVLVGWMRGGLGMVSVVSSMIFASLSGSGSADAGAIGALMIPPMVKKGYHGGFAASIVASGAVIGPIIPPSILIVLWCSMTGISVGAAFLSGVIPGIVMGISLMICVYMYAKKNPRVDEGTLGVRIPLREVLRIAKDASFALLVPIVVIGGIVFGVFTATEAAAIAIFLALFGGIFLYKELDISKMFKYLADTATTSASVMLVIGFAMTIGWALTIGRFSEILVNWITSLTTSPSIFLLIVIAVFTFLGTFMNAPAVIMIFAPILSPMCEIYGIHPIHFAIVCVMVIHIGAITPPVGGLLYISIGIAEVSLGDTLRYLWPAVAALTVTTIVTAFIPSFALFLPAVFGLI